MKTVLPAVGVAQTSLPLCSTALRPHKSVSPAQIQAFEEAPCRWPAGFTQYLFSWKHLSSGNKTGFNLDSDKISNTWWCSRRVGVSCGVKWITQAVSRRQPGDIYLWTHVSNLAITLPLINSLPESLPGEQEFWDSDRLMMRVSCDSVALKLYTD